MKFSLNHNIQLPLLGSLIPPERFFVCLLVCFFNQIYITRMASLLWSKSQIQLKSCLYICHESATIAQAGASCLEVSKSSFLYFECQPYRRKFPRGCNNRALYGVYFNNKAENRQEKTIKNV